MLCSNSGKEESDTDHIDGHACRKLLNFI